MGGKYIVAASVGSAHTLVPNHEMINNVCPVDYTDLVKTKVTDTNAKERHLVMKAFCAIQ